MRSRATLVLFVLALTAGTVLATASVSYAAPDLTLAQVPDAQPNDDEDVQGGEGQDGEGEGQSDPDAESGASQEETEGSTSPEVTGPPWTYQMARITIVLLVLLMLGLGYLYYRLVASRRKGEV
ncbi:MAG: hypothetical protein M3198_09250 [Actinomycetota bacterium]|nr:hypothetical protein [Actinomycetota bacterium]